MGNVETFDDLTPFASATASDRSNYLNRCEAQLTAFSLNSLVAMANSIKLFQFLQKYNRAMGIDSIKESNDICCGINWKKFIFLAAEVQYTVELMAFMFFEAETIFEYGTIFFGIASSIFSIVTHLIYSRQMKNFSEFNENCEHFIEKSEGVLYHLHLFSLACDLKFLINSFCSDVHLKQENVRRAHIKN